VATTPALPADFTAFVEAAKSLDYDPADAEPGMLVLRGVDELSHGALYVNSREIAHDPVHDEPNAGQDPHLDDFGYYVVPAVDLVASCTGDYPPQGLLAWLPDHGLYATWDSGHLDLQVFPGVTWTEIAASPLKYINAQWSNDPPGYYLAPWLHGCTFKRGSPWR
jgi:hypothetical protein